MGTRICHADTDTDADSNGIRIETSMSPLTFGGGHNKKTRIEIKSRKTENKLKQQICCIKAF